jgi:uncharacterized protein YyaL (SSP411 family)
VPLRGECYADGVNMKPHLATALVLLLISTGGASPATSPSIAWRAWSDGQFAQAKKEHKFVLLDLEAVWCHWCHVMDDTTYSDPTVQKLIGDKFIAVRVDQDSRPDISNRYEDYGWPATVVFDGDGHEIVKRRGYFPPKAMAAMLQAIIDDPTPGPSIQREVEVRPADSPSLADAQRNELIRRLKSDYDEKNGGWFGEQKYVDPNVIEYCLIDGDADLRKLACRTLDANLKLIDPVWGGVDQYSTDSDWDHPHFEKIMSTQAGNLRVYAQAYLATGDDRYLKAAERIRSFLKEFLTSPEGAFYVSQDADLHSGEHSAAYFKLDDADRRKLGVPRVDQHRYARENGWAIQSLCTLYAADQDRTVLDQAIAAADWVMKNRALGEGGFRHDETDVAGPYLGDTLAMGRAFLALYETTADRVWLGRVQKAMEFILANFKTDGGTMGLPTAANAGDSMLPAARPEVDENVDAVRFANLLFAYTGEKEDHDLAAKLMRYLAAPELAAHRGWAVGGILLADREIGASPMHVTIVGGKSDPAALQLFQTAMQAASGYKRIDWYDAAQGKLPNTDVEYPNLPYAAAFLCSGDACSVPMRTGVGLSAKLKGVEGLGVGGR